MNYEFNELKLAYNKRYRNFKKTKRFQMISFTVFSFINFWSIKLTDSFISNIVWINLWISCIFWMPIDIQVKKHINAANLVRFGLDLSKFVQNPQRVFKMVNWLKSLKCLNCFSYCCYYSRSIRVLLVAYFTKGQRIILNFRFVWEAATGGVL